MTSRDVLHVGESALYPALQRLLLNGWAKAEWGLSETNRRARYYHIDRRRPETACRRARGIRAHGSGDPARAGSHVVGRSSWVLASSAGISPPAIATRRGAARGDRGPPRAACGAPRKRRSDAAGGGGRQPSSHRQCPPRPRRCARGLARILGHMVAGRALRPAHLSQEPGVHRGGGGDARPRHRRQYGIFTVVNAVLFRDLSAPRAHELVSISQSVQGVPDLAGQEAFSTSEYFAYRDRAQTLSGLAGLCQREGGGDARRRHAAQDPRRARQLQLLRRAAAASRRSAARSPHATASRAPTSWSSSATSCGGRRLRRTPGSWGARFN